MDHFLYLILKIILSISKKKHDGKTINASVTIYVNKIENRMTFKIKTGYYIELLTPETMKLLGSTKSKIRKDEIGENVLYLEFTEVALVNWNIVNSNYQQSSKEFCIHLLK